MSAVPSRPPVDPVAPPAAARVGEPRLLPFPGMSAQPHEPPGAHGPAAANGKDAAFWTRVSLALFAIATVFRLFTVATLPLDLAADEAYYWDWSRQLDWGYYSKPPMVAWIIAGGTALLGSTELGVRWPAAACNLLGLAGVMLLGRRLYGPRAGAIAGLLAATTPGGAAAGMLMTIDAPLLTCWTWALLTAWAVFGKYVVTPGAVVGSVSRRSAVADGAWYTLAIAVLGLGLLSKQTMLALPALVALWMWTSPHPGVQSQRRLAVNWLLAGLFCLTPVLWWNSQHGWITFLHTAEHFKAPSAAAWWTPLSRTLDFWAGQLAMLSPVTGGLLWMALGRGLWTHWNSAWRASSPTQIDERARFLLCLSAVPLSGVLLLSLMQKVQPNWPAPFYLAGLIWLAHWLDERWASQGRRWCLIAVATGVCFSAGLVSSMWLLPASPLRGTRVDATARLRGWEELGQEIDRAMHAYELKQGATIPLANPSPGQRLIVAATGRGPVSELAFYLPGQPRVYRYNTGEIVDSQHDVWGGPVSRLGEAAWIITSDVDPIPAKLRHASNHVIFVETIEVHLGANRVHRYSLWRLDRLMDWPLGDTTRPRRFTNS